MSISTLNLLPEPIQEKLHALGNARDLLGRPLALETLISAHLATVEILLAGGLSYRDIADVLAAVGVAGGEPVSPNILRSAVSRSRSKRDAAIRGNTQLVAVTSNASKPMAAESGIKQHTATDRNVMQLVAAERADAQTFAATSSSADQAEVVEPQSYRAQARDPPSHAAVEAATPLNPHFADPQSHGRSDPGPDRPSVIPAKTGRIQISKAAQRLANKGKSHDTED